MISVDRAAVASRCSAERPQARRGFQGVDRMRYDLRWLMLMVSLFLPRSGWRLAMGDTLPSRPNILWITAEDMSPDLGCYGDTYAKTPALDRLANRSIRFSRCFAESPMCAPSRSSLITGIHTGGLGTSPMRSNHPIPSRFRAFAASLREAGYYCVNNVKTDYNVANEAAMVEDAWDESSRHAHWRHRPEGKPFFCVLNYMDTHQSRASRDSYAKFQSEVQVRLAPDEIHDPALAPLPPYYPETPVARRTVARYYDCITTLDHFVAQTLEELVRDGLANDTIIFFFSDHGAGLPGGKAAPFRRGLHVPLLVSFPHRFRHLSPAAGGTVSDRLVSFVDFGPTVLNLAGVPKPEGMQGVAFLGEQLAAPVPYVYGTRDRMDETLETTRWISDGQFHLVRSYDPRPPADQQTMLSLYNGEGELCRELRETKAAGKVDHAFSPWWQDGREPLMLFDGIEDPWCLRNLADEPAYREVREQLLEHLEARILEERDLGFWPEAERSQAERGMPAYERAREAGGYPLAAILEIARLVGYGAHHRGRFEQALTDADPTIRYWAAVGLAAMNEDVLPSLPRLRQVFAELSGSAKIVAAEILVRHDPPQREAALAWLAEQLDAPNEWLACRAARALELLGPRASSQRTAMANALQRRSAGFFGQRGVDPVNYSLEFALTSALQALE
jgi:N-sulfoglucosamine sulfohydrolase